MKSRMQALRMTQNDYSDQPQRRLGLNELTPNQKVYVGFTFAMDQLHMLPALVLAVLNERVRVRIPSPPGHDNLTTVKTIKPKLITHRAVSHDVVDLECNKSRQEIELEQNERANRKSPKS